MDTFDKLVNKAGEDNSTNTSAGAIQNLSGPLDLPPEDIVRYQSCEVEEARVYEWPTNTLPPDTTDDDSQEVPEESQEEELSSGSSNEQKEKKDDGQSQNQSSSSKS